MHLDRARLQGAVDAVLREVRQRTRVHLRVLPHLELGQVEPEGLHLPDQPLQVAVRRPRRTGLRQRALHDVEVGLELRGRAVREVRVARPRRGDPLGQEVDDPTVRLVGGVARDPRGQRRGQAALALPQGAQLGGAGGAGRVEGEPVRGLAGRRLELQQGVLGGHRRGGLGDLGGDVRVAVAVAADPRPEPRERAHRRSRGARGVGQQPVVEAAVHGRQHVGQGRLEHVDHGADLVEHRRLGLPQRGGAPERVDLAQQPAVVLRQRHAARVAQVALGDELGDAADGAGHRPATGLGRVRGEHGPELELREPLPRDVLPHLVGQLRDRRRQRVVRRQVVRQEVGLAVPQDAHAVELLRGVGQVEVARERPRDLLGAGQA